MGFESYTRGLQTLLAYGLRTHLYGDYLNFLGFLMASRASAVPHKPVILVAEDDELIRSLVSEFLCDAGFEIIDVENAADALQVISSKPVDLLFSDVDMHGEMQGNSLADWLKTRRPQLPVLLTSGRGRLPVQGSDRRFISKPYALVDVERQIRDLLH